MGKTKQPKLTDSSLATNIRITRQRTAKFARTEQSNEDSNPANQNYNTNPGCSTDVQMPRRDADNDRLSPEQRNHDDLQEQTHLPSSQTQLPPLTSPMSEERISVGGNEDEDDNGSPVDDNDPDPSSPPAVNLELLEKRISVEGNEDENDNSSSDDDDDPGSGSSPAINLELLEEQLAERRKAIYRHTFRRERAHHHCEFLRSCRDINRFPAGLTFSKNINVMKGRSAPVLHSSIDDIMARATLSLVQALTVYYEALIDEEDGLLATAATEFKTLQGHFPQHCDPAAENFLEDVDAKANRFSGKLAEKRRRKLQSLRNPKPVVDRPTKRRKPRQSAKEDRTNNGNPPEGTEHPTHLADSRQREKDGRNSADSVGNKNRPSQQRPKPLPREHRPPREPPRHQHGPRPRETERQPPPRGASRPYPRRQPTRGQSQSRPQHPPTGRDPTPTRDTRSVRDDGMRERSRHRDQTQHGTGGHPYSHWDRDRSHQRHNSRHRDQTQHGTGGHPYSHWDRDRSHQRHNDRDQSRYGRWEREHESRPQHGSTAAGLQPYTHPFPARGEGSMALPPLLNYPQLTAVANLLQFLSRPHPDLPSGNPPRW